MAIKIASTLSQPIKAAPMPAFREQASASEPKPQTKSDDTKGVYQRKLPITIRLRPNTIAKFKATGKGWQSRISAILDEQSEKL